MRDSTRQLVISFYDFYGKGQGRLDAVLKKHNVTLYDITKPQYATELGNLMKAIKDLAEPLTVSSCSEAIDLDSYGIQHGACIDGSLINRLFSKNASSAKDKNQRLECGCVESVDMGIYNTCHFRCAYCYANFNEGMIDSNSLKHDPHSPALLGSYDRTIEIQTSLHKKKKCGGCQQNLF